MSGSGLIASPVEPRRTDAQERADCLAYLERKIANALAIIARGHGDEPNAAAMRRAWEVARDDIRAGIHEGDATVAGLLSGDGEAPEIEGVPV